MSEQDTLLTTEEAPATIPSADEMRSASKEKGHVPKADAPAASTPAAGVPTTRQVPIEHGPLTLKDACVIVANKYNGMFNQLQYQLEPIVRDGGIVRFMTTGGQMELASGVLRTAPDVIYDDKHNAFLPLVVYNISYPRQPTPVKFA